jgi:hypothetical protein
MYIHRIECMYLFVSIYILGKITAFNFLIEGLPAYTGATMSCHVPGRSKVSTTVYV